MVEELPGFIPRVLHRDDVSLLRAGEAVTKTMVDGWRAHLLVRGLAASTITARCSEGYSLMNSTNRPIGRRC